MSKEELDALRNEQIGRKERPKYDGRYRDFKGEPPAGIEPVIRIKAPTSGTIELNDGVKGEVKFEVADMLDDFIIARSDGSATYNFTVVVDDALMGVTDIIRGDDHLSNTPKQMILYDALGFDMPNFYHVAMINGPDGQKLSKRHGATDVMEYKYMGYLPEALLNFLVRLGWSHGDDEIFSMKELKELFDPHSLSKSASSFNQSKLEWLNQHYIKEASFERLRHELKEFDLNLDEVKHAKLLIDSLRERSVTLVQMSQMAKTILNKPTKYEEKPYKKFIKPDSIDLLSKFSEILGDKDMDTKGYEELTTKFLEDSDKKLKDIAQPLRIAITGSSVSPGIFEVMEIIGTDELKNRVENLVKFSKSGEI